MTCLNKKRVRHYLMFLIYNNFCSNFNIDINIIHKYTFYVNLYSNNIRITLLLGKEEVFIWDEILLPSKFRLKKRRGNELHFDGIYTFNKV